MPNSDTRAYSTRIPKEEADKIKSYRKRNGLNKSEALRELAVEGLRADKRRRSYFERALVSMISIGFAATLVLLVSFVAIAVAGAVGATVPTVSPWQVLGSISLTMLVAATGFLAGQLRVGERLDAYLNALGDRLDRRHRSDG
jgi:hypothetical protein